MSEITKCRGFIIDATLGYGGENYATKSVTLYVKDEDPEVDGDTVGGEVLGIQIGEGTDAETLMFDLDQTRAFIEACQNILARYDDVAESDSDSDDEQGL